MDASPLLPGSPLSPRGIVRLSVCDGDVPVTVADALDPAAPVVTVPTPRTLAGPALPGSPSSPFAPRSEVSHAASVPTNPAATAIW